MENKKETDCLQKDIQAHEFQNPHNTLWKGPCYCNTLPTAVFSRPKY